MANLKALRRHCLWSAYIVTVAAQCQLPASPPADTEWADVTPTCGNGATLPTGQTCEVQCTRGRSQDASATYEFSCTGVALSDPEPDCTLCTIGQYNSEPGADTCEDCPENASTPGVGAEVRK